MTCRYFDRCKWQWQYKILDIANVLFVIFCRHRRRRRCFVIVSIFVSRVAKLQFVDYIFTAVILTFPTLVLYFHSVAVSMTVSQKWRDATIDGICASFCVVSPLSVAWIGGQCLHRWHHLELSPVFCRTEFILFPIKKITVFLN